ncbi:endolytic transglycosylase MltG, partial [Candidatus Saccharibacteria bacterium]|nr:endolytic transglycosylase MltG [Candidatus Saccharibacteria bacterium]
GSDVTVFYARDVNDSRYDTTEHKGLPPGPISTVSDSTLGAVAFPAKTSWLYFVTGDNGKTYFSKTFEQHQRNIDKYCHKLCS